MFNNETIFTVKLNNKRLIINLKLMFFIVLIIFFIKSTTQKSILLFNPTAFPIN